MSLPERNGERKVRFELVGIVHHEGTINRGHYYADVRLGYEWYELNDDKVYKSSIQEKGNISKSAYMLLYVKT